MSETSELAAETLHLQRTARIVGDPRILIIDDEDAIRESLDTLLTLEGFTVSAAVDGPSGLELLARNEYDLLLLDLALPGESGLDLPALCGALERLASAGAARDIGGWWERM